VDHAQAWMRPGAREVDRQVAESRVPPVLNGFPARGRPIAEVAGNLSPGKGKARPAADLRNRAGPRRRWRVRNLAFAGAMVGRLRMAGLS
jgi:hypothetical protein